MNVNLKLPMVGALVSSIYFRGFDYFVQLCTVGEKTKKNAKFYFTSLKHKPLGKK